MSCLYRTQCCVVVMHSHVIRKARTETWSENLMVGAHFEYKLGVRHPHRLSFRMWYVSFACLPCVALLCLHSIYAIHPHISLLFLTSLHSTNCTLLYRLALVVHTIPCVPLLPSIPPFEHCTYWRTLVVRVIYSKSPLYPSHLFNASLPLRFTLAVFPALLITRQTMVSLSKYF
jgi:hypothetical protein